MRLLHSPARTLGALVLATAPLMSADFIQFHSGTNQTALVELYTSEGCSSCPPAEAWFSRLKDSPKLWQEFVPVAFHVDYWDYLGWKDPFAAKAYSERQRAYASRWRSRTVYTPGFVRDGQEWRGWNGGDAPPRAGSKGVGTLSAQSEDGRQWTLRFQPAAASVAPGEFHAALLGFDLATDVKAGENRGRRLPHDFVVLVVADVVATKAGDAFSGGLSLKSPPTASPKRTALAVWVTARLSMEPLQSLGGWLPAPIR